MEGKLHRKAGGSHAQITKWFIQRTINPKIRYKIVKINTYIINMGAVNSTECSSDQTGFSLYKSACMLYPDLKSFDSKLWDITMQVINSLAAGIKDCSPSVESIIAVNNSFVQVTEDVFKVIDDEKENIWKSKQLHGLVENYFQLSRETLDICSSIEECLDRARNSQLSIELAVRQFDEEQRGNVGVGGSKENLYSKTLKRLEEFKMNDEIFTQAFFDKLDSLIAAQALMLDSLKNREIEKLNIWKRVCLRMFGATSYLMRVCKVTLLRFRAPQFLIQLSEVASEGIESMDRWLNQIWGVYENDLTTSMSRKTSIAIRDLNLIVTDVNNLKIKIKAFLVLAEFALSNHYASAVETAIDDIKKKLTGFKQVIQDLVESNEKCRIHTRKAMIDVSDKIAKYSST